jgi:2,4-dienoyl-CoA reductase-like NADH-dependent reductase (Old Yellow Enzyme family)/thioredoxin reductase
MTAHGAGYVDPDPTMPGFNLPAANCADYYAERARGGVGLIIQGGTIIDAASKTPGNWQLFTDAAVDAWRPVVSAVHDAGAKMFVQLMQQGHHGDHLGEFGGPYSPSTVPPVEGGMVWTPFSPLVVPVQAMDEPQIRGVIESFAHCAANAARAGYDGVEMHASHGYLVEQFLSPFYNKRRDGYGGSLANRMRFMIECLEAMRTVMDDGMALGLRLNCDENVAGGLSPTDFADIAHQLDGMRLVDFFDLDVGTYHTFETMIAPALEAGDHWQLERIQVVRAQIRNAVVFGCPGRFHDPRAAEALIAADALDMVGGTRGFFADPFLARKASEGRLADIRPCIGLNMCLTEAGCVMNPAKGREAELGEGTFGPAATPRRIVVVGGGPAGLEAARVAAIRGHSVVLFDGHATLGGSLHLMKQVPGRENVVEAAAWWDHQLTQLGVDVRRGTWATPEVVLVEQPDAIVVAAGAGFDRTGATGFISEPIAGWDHPMVVTPTEVLADTFEASGAGKIVVIDEFWNALSACVALALGARGAPVHWVTRHSTVGHNVQGLQWPAVWKAIRQHSMTLHPNAYVRKIDEHTVTLFDVYTDAEEVLDGVDAVVMITGRAARTDLTDALRGCGVPLHVIGDAKVPREMLSATSEGHLLGREL